MQRQTEGKEQNFPLFSALFIFSASLGVVPARGIHFVVQLDQKLEKDAVLLKGLAWEENPQHVSAEADS